MIAGNVRSPSTRNPPHVLFVFAICLFWLSNSGRDTSEGENHYAIAKLFVETGEIGFDHPVDGIYTTAPNGKTYASHEFGNVVLLIPTATANHAIKRLLASAGQPVERISRVEQFIVSFQAGLYSALTLVFLFLILRDEYEQTTRQAATGCLALAVCTYFWTYSRNLFDGVLCGLLLTAAMRYLMKYRRIGCLGDAAIAFALLGFSVDTRLSMILAVAVAFGFVTMSRQGSWRAAAVAVLALAPFGAWQLWYNHLRTGNPLVSPVQTAQYAANNALDGDLITGLIGLIASPGKSLFIYAPILLLSIFGFRHFYRRDRTVALMVIVLACLWLLLHAKLRSWYGAWGWGPRHMITMLPMLALPGLAVLHQLWHNKWWRFLVAGTATSGFVLAFASILGNWHYRMGLAVARGMSDQQFVWSVIDCQPLDMIRGAIRACGQN